MVAHLAYDQKRILLTVDSRKSRNVNLKSKSSLESFPDTNSTILFPILLRHFLSNNNKINFYQKNQQNSLIEICKITNSKTQTILSNLSNVQENVHNYTSFQ